ncbi:hypothetical protein [Enterococcus nangangensis]|uniref:hypothetical protein n=1 Tax=Enterococcus nangangensis TaxID=2559926 RepID=UPI0010F9B9C8|nr:hypothetical protein [Enterococcus nangangensis]
MNDFYQVYTPAQQFNLLQAYADEILTPAELLNFFLDISREKVPLILTPLAFYPLHPQVNFADFTYDHYCLSDVELLQKGATLQFTACGHEFHLDYPDTEAASTDYRDFIRFWE